MSKKGMERLSFMIGSWNVDAHIMSEAGEWLNIELPKSTTIISMLNGASHREEMPVSVDGVTTRFFFSWSFDKYRQVYRMISCDDAEGLMSVLEGNFVEGTDTVLISDLNTGTAVLDSYGQPAVYRCLSSSKTSENSFIDLVSESNDAGKTWIPVFRAIHSRSN